MNNARHVMIRASAGSGKTFALTNRFVELLARGASPEKIVALTFTRKAAGEFFDEILNKLARAARDDQAAKKLGRAIDLPQWRTADFLRLLRQMTDAMPRLRLGTLDGFFATIARSFPLELGLAGKFELLEEHSARTERARVLRQLFAGTEELNSGQKEFVEAFKRATFGREEKRFTAQLDAFLDDYHEKYLVAPEGALWGNPRMIWPAGNPWLNGKSEIDPAVRTLREWIENSKMADKQRQRWQDFLAAAESWRPGAPAQLALIYVLKKTLSAWDEIRAGNAVLEFDRKKQELNVPLSAALAALTHHLMAGEITRRLETTKGIHAVLSSYEAVYNGAVRRAGKLTFADVQRLLMPDHAPALTGDADASDGRLYIDYRLDGVIDHWLLDEFQDTSVGQWSVLRNLIDEAVQDPSGKRTFFCVGDVKQAIYTWREGDPRLFQDVLDHYNAMAPGTIVEKEFVESWRSGPALIEMVNAVFGKAERIEELFPHKTARAWNSVWSDHTSAVPERVGHAALIYAEDEPARWRKVLQLLQEIRPLERGLSCAVLVQKNATAAELADFLRREGKLPALAESDFQVCADNPLGAALLALVHVAAHPGDTFAWEHLQMTPLGEMLAEQGISTPSALTELALSEIHARGFEQLAEKLLTQLERHLARDDAFARLRARQFVEAARIFDESGSRDFADFIAFMERYTVRDAESASTIRVMTIHKSKGLGFDVVLLPDLEGRKLDQRRKGLAVQKTADRSVEWILDLPNEIFREGDPVLSSHVGEAEAEAGYEALSLLYVAMTRAKRAMYAIIEPVGDSSSLNYPKLLTATLGSVEVSILVGSLVSSGVWKEGKHDWYNLSDLRKNESEIFQSIPMMEAIHSLPALRRSGHRPSDGHRRKLNVASLFLARGAAEFGAEVHQLLAEIEWVDTSNLVQLATKWIGQGTTREAMETVLACLHSPEMAALWKQPQTGRVVEVWRERAFEVVLDGIWFTGVFDRVLVEYDQQRRAISAWVIDFKTDRGSDQKGGAAQLLEKHAGQINLYRDAAAILTGLPAQAVRGTLALTAQLSLMEVGPSP